MLLHIILVLIYIFFISVPYIHTLFLCYIYIYIYIYICVCVCVYIYIYIYYCVYVCHCDIILNSSVVFLLQYVCCVIMCSVCFWFVYHVNVLYFLRYKFSGMLGCQLVNIWPCLEEYNASISRVKLSKKCSPWSA